MPSRVSWKKDFIPLKVVSSSRCSDLKDPTCFSLLWISSFFLSQVSSCWTSPSLRSKNRLNLCVHWCRRNPFNTLFKYTVAWQYLLTLHCQKPDYFATILQKLQDTFNCVWHVTALTLQCLVATPPICMKLSVSHCFDSHLLFCFAVSPAIPCASLLLGSCREWIENASLTLLQWTCTFRPFAGSRISYSCLF